MQDMDSEDSVGYTNMLGQFEVKAEMVLMSIKVDKTPGLEMLVYCEMQEEIARALMEIFESSRVTDVFSKECRGPSVVSL